MVDSLLQDYRVYVRRIRKLLSLGGYLPSGSIRPSFAYTPACLSVTMCFFMSCCTFNFCLTNATNLSVLMTGMSVVCSFIGATLKATSLFLRRKAIIELFETLEGLFDEEIRENPGAKPALLSLLRTFDRPTYIYSFLVAGTLCMYLLPPIISIIHDHTYGVENVKYRLPYPAAYPWNIPGGGTLYKIHFLYETILTWFMFCITFGVDALFGFCMFHIAALLKGMSYHLQNPRPSENRLELFKSCTKKHLQLLKCQNIVQQVFEPIILWLVLTNGMAMCALVFQTFQITRITMRLTILLGFYMFLKMMQTFLYAWYGSLVTHESEGFRDGLYFSDWQGKEAKYLKTAVIISMLQKPIAIKVSGFFVVSVDMFSKIMNATISYFFLLQTLDESG